MRTILLILLFLLLLAAPVAAQERYPTDGRVDEPAKSFLALHYRADLEQGYCITRWSVIRDTVVVQEVIATTGVLDQGPYHVVFLCPQSTVPLHTHPPQFPQPSAQDIVTALIQGGEPFAVIQWAPDRFAFWIHWARVQAMPGQPATGRT